MNHEIVEQQIANIDKRLKVIEDKYPTVEPKYVEEMAKVMKSNGLSRLTVGQICIEITTQEKK